MIHRYEPLKSTERALTKVMRESGKEPQAVYPDEDTVTFTRTEVKEIWAYVLGTNRELSDWRESI